MPSTLTYPGVYVEEIPSGVRTIVGVATSITAFVGRAARGPVNEATTITSYADFERTFGGLDLNSPMSFAVRDFFQNGGSQAVIVRLFHDKIEQSKPAIADLTLGTSVLLQAISEGSWGQYLRGVVDFDVSSAALKASGLEATPSKLFNLTIRDARPGGAVEIFRNVTTTDSPRRIDRVLKSQSELARWKNTFTATTVDGELNPKYAVLATAKALPETNTTEKEAKKNAIAKALVDSKLTDTVTAEEVKLADAISALLTELAKPKIDETEIGKKRKAVDAAKSEVDNKTKERADAATDGGDLTFGDFFPTDGADKKLGLYALERTDLFNLLCIPSFGDTSSDILKSTNSYCERRRAMLIVDPPKAWRTEDGKIASAFKSAPAEGLSNAIGLDGPVARNAALYFPRVKYPNQLREGRVEEFAACGIIAGQFAKTDVTRGVWKAPAGLDAALVGVQSLAVNMTDAENGLLNPLGINCLRAFPVAGRVIWGARTLRGADALADEYKYVPVRRTALYIEESLYRGTQWAVFEPNDEPLWAQLRLNIGSFMHDLFRQGAFQGRSPREAYFVKCDKETTTQSDINKGIVNVVVGFAPLKPAEFVVIKLQQIAGQLEA